jgi:hypothetical protein
MKCGFWISGIALTAVFAVAATAQDDNNPACTDLATDAETIACLRARIVDLEGRAPSADAGEPGQVLQQGREAADAAIAAPAAAAPTAAAAATATESPPRRFGLRMPRVPTIFGRGDVDEAPDEPARETAAVVDLDEFGAEQVARRQNTHVASRSDGDEETLHAEVVEFEYLSRDRLVVTLDNGQVWRQTEILSLALRLRDDEPMGVEIWRSGFGGYRLRAGDRQPVIKVERLR